MDGVVGGDGYYLLDGGIIMAHGMVKDVDDFFDFWLHFLMAIVGELKGENRKCFFPEF